MLVKTWWQWVETYLIDGRSELALTWHCSWTRWCYRGATRTTACLGYCKARISWRRWFDWPVSLWSPGWSRVPWKIESNASLQTESSWSDSARTSQEKEVRFSHFGLTRACRLCRRLHSTFLTCSSFGTCHSFARWSWTGCWQTRPAISNHLSVPLLWSLSICLRTLATSLTKKKLQ